MFVNVAKIFQKMEKKTGEGQKKHYTMEKCPLFRV